MMKSLLSLLAVVLLCGSAYGSSYLDSNRYLDSVLQQPFFRQELVRAYADPYPLSNITHEFSDKTAKGKATYFNGQLTGFGLVHREGNCEAPRRLGAYVSLNCTLAFDRVGVDYKGQLKYGVLPQVNFQVKGNFTKTLAFVQVVQRVPSNPPEIRTLQVVQMGAFKSKYSKLTPLSRFENTLRSKFDGIVTPQFHTVFNGRFRDVLQHSVARIALPPV